jgi:hypothetical protein
MPVELHNSVRMGQPPDVVYDYVTQPWRWHEWHPNSRSASQSDKPLVAGSSFDEVIAVQPLAPLPWTLQRQTRYVVEQANRPNLWQVRGQMGDGWLVIRYVLQADGNGTRFDRTLTFETRGPTRLLMPVLKRQMARMSALALANLTQKLAQLP